MKTLREWVQTGDSSIATGIMYFGSSHHELTALLLEAVELVNTCLMSSYKDKQCSCHSSTTCPEFYLGLGVGPMPAWLIRRP